MRRAIQSDIHIPAPGKLDAHVSELRIYPDRKSVARNVTTSTMTATTTMVTITTTTTMTTTTTITTIDRRAAEDRS